MRKKAINLQVKPLKDYAQQVWMLKTLEDKKLVALEMINQFDHKKKSLIFKKNISECLSVNKLDEMVSNIMLTGMGLGVK